ncbi:conserved hypothetical protein (partial), partial [Bordetella avium 197N]
VVEAFFGLSRQDRLEYARAETGRPAHLLEKDIWVVAPYSHPRLLRT